MDPVRGRFYNKRGINNRVNGVTRMMGYQRSCFIFRGVACINYQ